MTEDYTPSIHIEPPPDSDEQGLFDFSVSLGMFDNNNYCPPPEREMTIGMADRCYPSAPALFIQPSDSSSVSELSPLDEISPFLPAEYRYSPSTSGRSSPIDPWSPVSSFSGDIFPEDGSEDIWAHQRNISGHSSPSLSPLTDALDGVRLDERYPPVDQSVLLNGPPIVSRLRSSSHSVQGVSPAEVWVDGVGRGRSASFTASTTDTQFFRNEGAIPIQYGYSPNAEVPIAMTDVQTTFSESLGTGMSWGAGTNAIAAENSPAPGQLVPGWRYPTSEQPSADSHQERPPASPSLLTVPSLQRRPACSARQRSRSHSDLTSLVPPEQDLGRGRGQHRTTLSIPNSRSVSYGHSRASSRDSSPNGSVSFSDVQTPASFSSSSPSSPAFEDAEAGADLGRRHTFTAIRGSDDLLSPIPSLTRASSAPSKGRRSKIVSSHRNTLGLGVFKAVKTEASSSAFLSPEGSDGSQQEFRVAQPPVLSFKSEVASKKIRAASTSRRINAALFSCPLETCSSTFTARHNLINHINSHNKYRPHKCLCGMSFTTQGVLNRHKKRCRK